MNFEYKTMKNPIISPCVENPGTSRERETVRMWLTWNQIQLIILLMPKIGNTHSAEKVYVKIRFKIIQTDHLKEGNSDVPSVIEASVRVKSTIVEGVDDIMLAEISKSWSYTTMFI